MISSSTGRVILAMLIAAATVVFAWNSDLQMPSDGGSDYVSGEPRYIYDANLPSGRRWRWSADARKRAGRNILRGFPVSQANLAVHKQFQLNDCASRSGRRHSIC